MRVRSIYPDSPAEKAGLEEGDVVTAVDGRPVESREDFETFLTSSGPGRKVELTVKRKGKDTAAATLTTLFVLPAVFALVRHRSSRLSVSLDPDDPQSGQFISPVAPPTTSTSHP